MTLFDGCLLAFGQGVPFVEVTDQREFRVRVGLPRPSRHVFVVTESVEDREFVRLVAGQIRSGKVADENPGIADLQFGDRCADRVPQLAASLVHHALIKLEAGTWLAPPLEANRPAFFAALHLVDEYREIKGDHVLTFHEEKENYAKKYRDRYGGLNKSRGIFTVMPV